MWCNKNKLQIENKPQYKSVRKCHIMFCNAKMVSEFLRKCTQYSMQNKPLHVGYFLHHQYILSSFTSSPINNIDTNGHDLLFVLFQKCHAVYIILTSRYYSTFVLLLVSSNVQSIQIKLQDYQIFGYVTIFDQKKFSVYFIDHILW